MSRASPPFYTLWTSVHASRYLVDCPLVDCQHQYLVDCELNFKHVEKTLLSAEPSPLTGMAIIFLTTSLANHILNHICGKLLYNPVCIFNQLQCHTYLSFSSLSLLNQKHKHPQNKFCLQLRLCFVATLTSSQWPGATPGEITIVIVMLVLLVVPVVVLVVLLVVLVVDNLSSNICSYMCFST